MQIRKNSIFLLMMALFMMGRPGNSGPLNPWAGTLISKGKIGFQPFLYLNVPEEGQNFSADLPVFVYFGLSKDMDLIIGQIAHFEPSATRVFNPLIFLPRFRLAKGVSFGLQFEIPTYINAQLAIAPQIFWDVPVNRYFSLTINFGAKIALSSPQVGRVFLNVAPEVRIFKHLSFFVEIWPEFSGAFSGDDINLTVYLAPGFCIYLDKSESHNLTIAYVFRLYQWGRVEQDDTQNWTNGRGSIGISYYREF